MLECTIITSEDFKCLLSFPNLSWLNCSHTELKLPSVKHLVKHPNLEKIVFWYHGLQKWQNVSFPKNLKHLELVGTNIKDISSIIFPKTLESLSLQSIFMIDFSILKDNLPQDLMSLTLIETGLTTIIVDDLPCCLQELTIISGKIKSIEGKSWPSSLETICLNKNELNDDELELINETVRWPPRLKRLDLGFNNLSNTYNLISLPQTLKTLRITKNSWIWENNGPRLKFPTNLTELDMRFCEISTLQNFQFPLSLEILDLTQNNINDILSYKDWEKLINLTKLCLWSNKITSLKDWIIPPNLIRLGLQRNSIDNISPSFPLFKKDYDFKLVELDISSCLMNNIDIDFIPTSLKILNISNNQLGPIFLFPECLIQLQDLNLSYNRITRVLFQDPYHIEIQKFSLAGNKIKTIEFKDDDYDSEYNLFKKMPALTLGNWFKGEMES